MFSENLEGSYSATNPNYRGTVPVPACLGTSLGTRTLCFLKFLVCYALIPNTKLPYYASIMLHNKTTYYTQSNASILCVSLRDIMQRQSHLQHGSDHVTSFEKYESEYIRVRVYYNKFHVCCMPCTSQLYHPVRILACVLWQMFCG